MRVRPVVIGCVVVKTGLKPLPMFYRTLKGLIPAQQDYQMPRPDSQSRAACSTSASVRVVMAGTRDLPHRGPNVHSHRPLLFLTRRSRPEGSSSFFMPFLIVPVSERNLSMRCCSSYRDFDVGPTRHVLDQPPSQVFAGLRPFRPDRGGYHDEVFSRSDALRPLLLGETQDLRQLRLRLGNRPNAVGWGIGQ